MFKVNVPVPKSAYTRIRRQTSKVGPFHSCHQSFELTVCTFAQADAHLATPGNTIGIILTDNDNVLPYSTLEFVLQTSGPVDPLTWQPWNAGLYLTAAENTVALAATFLMNQFNAFFRNMVYLNFPAFKTARAIYSGAGAAMYIELPWGLLGAAGVTRTGPVQWQTTAFYSGVDNPFWAGIRGKPRHILRVAPRYPGPYYGPAPET